MSYPKTLPADVDRPGAAAAGEALRFETTAGEPSRLGFSSHLLMISAVLSLCGSCTELLLRYRALPVNPTLVVSAAAFLLMAMRRESSFRRGQVRLMGLLVFIIGWGTIGMLTRPSADTAMYAHAAGAILTGGMLAWFLIWLPHSDKVIPSLSSYCGCGLLLMGLVFAPFVLSGTHPPGDAIDVRHIHAGVARLPWTLDSPNYFSSNLVVMNLLCLHGLLNPRGPANKALCAAGLAAGVWMQVLTMSRGGIISVLFGIAVYLLLLRRKRFGVVCVVGIAVGIIASNALLTELLSLRFMKDLGTDASLASRIDQHQLALQLGVEFPFGAGLHQSGGLVAQVLSHHVHSTYLKLFAELGIIGSGILCFPLLVLLGRWMGIGRSLRTDRQAGDRGQPFAEWVLLTAMCAGVLLIACSTVMNARTSLWSTIGLMAWFAGRVAGRHPTQNAQGPTPQRLVLRGSVGRVHGRNWRQHPLRLGAFDS